MSDSVIDAIRNVDPCPVELAPPPIEGLRRRLGEEPAAARPHASHRRPALGTFILVLSSATATAIAVVAIALLRHADRSGSPAARSGSVVGTRACRPQIKVGVLPRWARDGFSQPHPRMPYALGRSGRIAAIVWVALDSPPAPDHNNKILWVSRVPTRYGHALAIQAQRMDGTRRLGMPVNRAVSGGPGPSIINVPAPGCWRFTLRWSGWTDQIDLEYKRPA